VALFWLSDEAWAAIEPHLPRNQPGARRVDDRRVISGILHVLKVGCRWCDCPTDYGPSTTVYNRFNRWSRRGFWLKLLDALVDAGAVTKNTAIDSTYVKAQRAAFSAKGGRSAQAIGRSRGGWTTKVHALTDVIGRPFALMLTAGNVSDVKAAPALLKQAGRMRYLLADKGYDADQLRRSLRDAGAVPVIPAGAAASAPSATTRNVIAAVTSSRTPSAASRTFAVSIPATTNSPPTSSQSSPLPPL
jgi:transposase